MLEDFHLRQPLQQRQWVDRVVTHVKTARFSRLAQPLAFFRVADLQVIVPDIG
jgi:hypothetical protein